MIIGRLHCETLYKTRIVWSIRPKVSQVSFIHLLWTCYTHLASIIRQPHCNNTLKVKLDLMSIDLKWLGNRCVTSFFSENIAIISGLKTAAEKFLFISRNIIKWNVFIFTWNLFELFFLIKFLVSNRFILAATYVPKITILTKVLNTYLLEI